MQLNPYPILFTPVCQQVQHHEFVTFYRAEMTMKGSGSWAMMANESGQTLLEPKLQ